MTNRIHHDERALLLDGKLSPDDVDRGHYLRAAELPKTLGDDAGKQVWIQVAKVGQWAGHASGPFKLSVSAFDEIVQNFRATQNQRIPIDFEHASELEPTSGTIPHTGAPAQGWMVDLDNRCVGGLWALVEWLEPARTYVMEGKYKYFSPALRFGAKDRVTGKSIGVRMTSGALTNQPFLDGMAELVAARDEAGETTLAGSLYEASDYMPLIKAAIRCDTTDDVEHCLKQLKIIARLYGAGEGTDVEIDYHGVPVSQHVRELRDALRMPIGSTSDQMFDLAHELLRSAWDEEQRTKQTSAAVAASDKPITTQKQEKPHMDHEKQIADLKAHNSELTLKLTASEAKAKQLETEAEGIKKNLADREEAEIAKEVDAAILTHKDSKGLMPEHRQHLLSFAKTNRDGFRAMYPAAAPGQEHLLRDLTGKADGPHQAKGSQSRSITLGDRVDELIAEKKLSPREARRQAAAEFRNSIVPNGGR